MSFTSRKKKSDVWEHFEQINSEVAKCRICKTTVSYKSTTSNLRKHIIRRHPTVQIISNQKRKPQQLLAENLAFIHSAEPSTQEEEVPSTSALQEPQPVFRPEPSTSQLKISEFMPLRIMPNLKKHLDEALLKLFTQDFQPFSIVEDKGFKQFVYALNPRYKLPSRKNISNTLIPAKYEECKIKLKNILVNSKTMSITTDCWTSRQNLSYLALTAHFIKDGKFINALLDCDTITDSHTSENLGRAIKSILGEWGIKSKVIFAVSDNAPNITSALRNLQMKFMGCAAHKINLIVQRALESPEVGEIINKIKKSVNHFRISTKCWMKLRDAQKRDGIDPPLKLINSVETRWNSTLNMVARFVELEVPIKTAVALLETNIPTLNSSEWQTAKKLVSILKPFKQITENLSIQKYPPASSLIVMIRGLIDVLNKYKSRIEYSDVKETLNILIKETQKRERFGNLEESGTLAVCTFLDPKYKIRGFKNKDGDTAHKAKLKVKELLIKKITESSQGIKDKAGEETMQVSLDEDSVYSSFLAETGSGTTVIESPESKALVELNRYLNDGLISLHEDPIGWWHTNRRDFPWLSLVAEEHLCITATSVPCEQLFSKAGMFLSERRSQLSPQKARMLLFINNNEELDIQ